MRTVLVTGSSRGIGFAIAKAFCETGDNVILNCRTDKLQLEKAVKELKTTGFCTDISDYSACSEMINKIEKEFGSVDILVNNAGESHFGIFSEMKPHEILNTINSNLMTALNISHLVIPEMVRKKSGCIINISSIWGIKGASCEVAYSAAKGGINIFTKALAKELAPSDIRVNAIACGAFETRMNERLTQEEKHAFTEEIPMGRFGLPQEAAHLAVFLASPSAAYLTGQIIPLDGGLI